jgi:hypothetical protein
VVNSALLRAAERRRDQSDAVRSAGAHRAADALERLVEAELARSDRDRALYQRQPRDAQPADERSGRYVLADDSLPFAMFSAELTVDGPRLSTPPSPLKALAFRLRETAREAAAPMAVGAALAVAWVVGLILGLPC